MTNKKYFFPAHESDTILVDAFYNKIWLATTDQTIAHRLRVAFYSKINLVVYDLHSFKNYEPNLIDNSVCTDWQITPSSSRLIQQSQHYEIINQTHQAQQDQLLINTRATLLLSDEKSINLQQQMMLYHYIFNGIDKLDEIHTTLETCVNDIFLYHLDLKDIELALLQLPFKLLYSSTIGRRLLTINNQLYA